MFPQGLHFRASQGLGRGHQLAVHVREADAVVIDESELAYARAHQSLGTPGAYAAHPEDDDALTGNPLHRFRAEHQLRPLENTVVHSRAFFIGQRPEAAGSLGWSSPP